MVLAGLVLDKQGAQTPKPFLEVAYGYLPLVWGATLAHYMLPLLSEAGRILPVRSHVQLACSQCHITCCLGSTAELS